MVRIIQILIIIIISDDNDNDTIKKNKIDYKIIKSSMYYKTA